jgi:putative spermidine/putrescine transport system substrate-binding protein
MSTPRARAIRHRAALRGLSGGLLSAVLAVALAACGTSSDTGADTTAPGQKGFTPPDLPMRDSLGKGEGAVNILAWPGYAEDGSTDPKVDWVSAFEKQTGCQAKVKYFGTSDEAVSLMRTGDYDVVSASGDASLRLIAAGTVAPFNTDLTTNYADVSAFLKDQSWNSVAGTTYGMPHGWGANLLMYNTKEVKPAPTSWAAVFDDAGQHKGKVTAYDSPIYIADAALYLKNTKPELGIENPYALDQKQLDAAVDLLKKQRVNVGEYWSDYTKEVSAFKAGSTVIGTTWQVIANIAQEDAPVKAFLPEEGSTGWSDTWMVAAKSQHPSCAYQWANYIVSPKANAAVAEYFGEAPANLKACSFTSDKGFCDTYHAGDAAYAKKIWYWSTPIKQCLDGRTDTTCTDYAAWTTAWQQIKG